MLLLTIHSIQMGMMKEHVRGSIKCCETLATDMCLQLRAEELVYCENFHPTDQVSKSRGREDQLGGFSHARVLGGKCTHTNDVLLRAMLSEILDEIADTHGGAWEPEDYQREDLVIEEFTGAIIGTSTHFSVDWNSGHKTTSDYFMYYSVSKQLHSKFTRDAGEPTEPSMAELGRTDKPPPIWLHQIKDYYNKNFVGQVFIFIVYLPNVYD